MKKSILFVLVLSCLGCATKTEIKKPICTELDIAAQHSILQNMLTCDDTDNPTECRLWHLLALPKCE